MSDTTLNRFLAQGTNAERLAFTPSPPTPASGPDPGYLFYETDTNDLYAWDDVGSSWTQITSGSPLTNPMTTSQDLIVGGSGGTPTRFGVGAVGTVLTVGSGGIIDWDPVSPVGGSITASGYTMATARVLGRDTAGTGAIEELTVTGTGAVVKATSPTLVTPALGTPSALVLTNATAVPAGQVVGVVPIANLATGTPTGAKFIRDDGTLQVPAGGGGTVTTVSVVSANGLAGSVANATTTPAITLSTSITGILKGNGTAIGAAVPNTDYVATGAVTGSGLTMTTSRVLGRATAGTGAIEEISVTGTGSVVLNGSPALTTPDLGTPSAAVLTNATGLPVASGISGLGSNVATFLATPSSANLAAAVTGETGTGALVFADTPTLVTPVIGAATGTSLTLTDGAVTNNIPQNSQSADYTCVLADRGKHIFHPVSDNNARVFTIPANASVAYAIGTLLTFSNRAATACTVAITSDTLTWLPSGGTGTRTIAQYGKCAAEKISATEWELTGVGIT